MTQTAAPAMVDRLNGSDCLHLGIRLVDYNIARTAAGTAWGLVLGSAFCENDRGYNMRCLT